MLMLAALFCFAVLDTTGKYLSQRYPVGVLVWARYLVPAIVLGAVLYPRMGETSWSRRAGNSRSCARRSSPACPS
jgi:hypothetical protein